MTFLFEQEMHGSAWNFFQGFGGNAWFFTTCI